MMAWTQITSLDASTGGVFDMSGLTLSSYKVVRLLLSALKFATDDADLLLRFYISSVEITTGYVWSFTGISTSSTFNGDGATGAAGILLNSNDANWGVGNAAEKSTGGEVTVADPGSTTLHKRSFARVSHIGPTGNMQSGGTSGFLANAGAITGFKVLPSSGTIDSGRVRVLGLA